MAYTKTNWKDGDVISAERMNKIEKGIEDAGASGGSEVIVIPFTYEAYTDSWSMESSFAEMEQAITEGKTLRFDISIDGNGLDTSRIIIGNNGHIYLNNDSDTPSFYTELFTHTTIKSSNYSYTGNMGYSGYLTITEDGINFNDVNIGVPYAVLAFYNSNNTFTSLDELTLEHYNVMNAYALNIPLVVPKNVDDVKRYYVFNPYGFAASSNEALAYFKGPNVKAASSTNLMPTDEIVITLNKKTGEITEVTE